jgi:hypothetical protein
MDPCSACNGFALFWSSDRKSWHNDNVKLIVRSCTQFCFSYHLQLYRVPQEMVGQLGRKLVECLEDETENDGIIFMFLPKILSIVSSMDSVCVGMVRFNIVLTFRWPVLSWLYSKATNCIECMRQ